MLSKHFLTRSTCHCVPVFSSTSTSIISKKRFHSSVNLRDKSSFLNKKANFQRLQTKDRHVFRDRRQGTVPRSFELLRLLRKTPVTSTNTKSRNMKQRKVVALNAKQIINEFKDDFEQLFNQCWNHIEKFSQLGYDKNDMIMSILTIFKRKKMVEASNEFYDFLQNKSINLERKVVSIVIEINCEAGETYNAFNLYNQVDKNVSRPAMNALIRCVPLLQLSDNADSFTLSVVKSISNTSDSTIRKYRFAKLRELIEQFSTLKHTPIPSTYNSILTSYFALDNETVKLIGKKTQLRELLNKANQVAAPLFPFNVVERLEIDAEKCRKSTEAYKTYKYNRESLVSIYAPKRPQSDTSLPNWEELGHAERTPGILFLGNGQTIELLLANALNVQDIFFAIGLCDKHNIKRSASIYLSLLNAHLRLNVDSRSIVERCGLIMGSVGYGAILSMFAKFQKLNDTLSWFFSQQLYWSQVSQASAVRAFQALTKIYEFNNIKPDQFKNLADLNTNTTYTDTFLRISPQEIIDSTHVTDIKANLLNSFTIFCATAGWPYKIMIKKGLQIAVNKNIRLSHKAYDKVLTCVVARAGSPAAFVAWQVYIDQWPTLHSDRLVNSVRAVLPDEQTLQTILDTKVLWQSKSWRRALRSPHDLDVMAKFVDTALELYPSLGEQLKQLSQRMLVDSVRRARVSRQSDRLILLRKLLSKAE